MTQVTAGSIAERFDRGIAANREDWSLREQRVRALDVVNHVLRCVIQLDYLDDYLDEFDALAELQRADGGWPDFVAGPRSGVRNTCFSTRNLIRANRRLRRDDYAERIERAVRFVTAAQDPGGWWPDRVWGLRDATSSGMGLLIYALRETFDGATGEVHDAAGACLRRAAGYLERTQEGDGSWHDPSSYEMPVGPTAHLLPKLVLHEHRRTPAVGAGIDYLVGQQEADGSWDRGHVDHTCDATRALLLTASVVDDERLDGVIEGGVRWLTDNVNEDGLWSERPGGESSLLLTCDVLDCFSKYAAHAAAQDLTAFWQ
jgi:hypothetical protein